MMAITLIEFGEDKKNLNAAALHFHKIKITWLTI